MNISLDDASAIIDRALRRAAALGVPMNIAVVDGGGQLLTLAGGFSDQLRIKSRGRRTRELNVPMLSDCITR